MTAAVPPFPSLRRHRRARAVTIREVASRAAVSVATVSRVLSGKGPVQATTGQRVRDAADALRYVPHSGARSLSTSRTNTIGVLLPDLYGEFFSEVIRGVDLAARRRGYHLLVSGSHSDRTEVSAVLTALRGRVDGILVMSPSLQASSIQGDLPAAGVPVVLLNCVAAGTDGISVDNYGGSRAMMRHLAGLGHRLIAFIKGPENNVDAHQRLRGYRMAMRAFGKSRLGGLELDGDFSEEAGYAAGGRLLSLQPRPTAVFAANDAMAIGALRAVQEAGIKVPEEMALAGFDDIPIARYLTPSLTTVNVAIAELGRRALEMLLTSMENPYDDEPQRKTIPTALVVRESCGAGLKKTQARPIRQIAINSNRRPRP